MHRWLSKIAQAFGFDQPVPEPRAGKPPLSERDLIYALTRAYPHECGHAVVAWLSPAVAFVGGIEFHPDGSAITTSYYQARHPELLTEQAVVSMGGLAGETLVFERVR